jgi:hypothetical protein
MLAPTLVVVTLALSGTNTEAPAGEPWAARRFLVFGNANRGWTFYDTRAGSLAPIRLPDLPGNSAPEEIASNSSPDLIVFTAVDRRTHHTLLYSLRSGAAERQLIGEQHGWHGWPAISLDRNWVYFSHSPELAGPPPFGEAPSSYPQLYRVHPNGTGLERLTGDGACHLGSTASATDIFYVNFGCTAAPAALVRRCALTGKTTRLPVTGRIEAVVISPDGHRVLYGTRGPVIDAIWEVDGQAAKKPRQMVAVGSIGNFGYGAQRSEIVYEDGEGVVWKTSGGAAVTVPKPRGAQP